MTSDDFTLGNFTANLKLVSSYHPSISSLCRKLGMNRQQFMKYLAGTSFPSRHNLRRICDFFGVDEFEILMPQNQFRTIFRVRPRVGGDFATAPPLLLALLVDAQRQKSVLTKTLGYYYEYYNSFSTPGQILRSLVQIYGWHEYTCYKRLERLRRPERKGPPDVYKYSGMATVVGDKMYMVDLETITGNELSQTILYLNYRNHVRLLTGLTIGVAGSDARAPCAAPVVMEYIGRSVNLRQAISECQLYHADSQEIPAAFRDILSAGGQMSGALRAASL